MHVSPPGLDARSTALFLDVDGTLLEIESRPSDVVVSAALLDLIERLERALDGALALISGRSLKEIDRLFGKGRFNAAGAHGAEIRLQGLRLPTQDVGAFPAAVEARLAEFANSDKRLLLEGKPNGVSLHYRGAPEREDACRDFVAETMQQLGDGYRLIAGKMVFEITPRGHDKGEAVDAFMARAPFAGRKAVFVGDDVTDEDGFRAANATGGTSIRVGTAEHSDAQHALADVAAVHGWLAEALA